MDWIKGLQKWGKWPAAFNTGLIFLFPYKTMDFFAN